MTVLKLCATCGNHGTVGEGRDRKPCDDCPRGREIAAILEQGRAEIRAIQAREQTPPRWCIAHGTDLWGDDERCECCEAEK